MEIDSCNRISSEKNKALRCCLIFNSQGCQAYTLLSRHFRKRTFHPNSNANATFQSVLKIMSASTIAAQNLRDLLEYYILVKQGLAPKEGSATRFLNVYDEDMIVELDGRHRDYDWWDCTCSQMHERKVEFSRLDIEPLDSMTFDCQLELRENGLDRPIYWHSVMWVHPVTSRIVKIRFLTGDMGQYLHEHNPNPHIDGDHEIDDNDTDDVSIIHVTQKRTDSGRSNRESGRPPRGRFSRLLTRLSSSKSSEGKALVN